MQILQNKTIPPNFCVSLETARVTEPGQLCHGLRASTERQPSLKSVMYKNGWGEKWMARTSESV